MAQAGAPLTAAAFFVFIALLVATFQFSGWIVISLICLAIALACGVAALTMRRGKS